MCSYTGWRSSYPSLLTISILLACSACFMLGYCIGKGDVLAGLASFVCLILFGVLALGGALADRELENDIKR